MYSCPSRSPYSLCLHSSDKKSSRLEQTRSPTLCKYVTACATLSGAKLDKGKNPYQDFARLFTLRDALVHIKARDQSGPRDGDAATFTMPKFVTALQQRRLAKPSRKTEGLSWLHALQTEKIAAWACKTALTMILAVLDMIPDSVDDPAAPFKQQLRSYKKL